jgi:hypothetical protein
LSTSRTLHAASSWLWLFGVAKFRTPTAGVPAVLPRRSKSSLSSQMGISTKSEASTAAGVSALLPGGVSITARSQPAARGRSSSSGKPTWATRAFLAVRPAGTSQLGVRPWRPARRLQHSPTGCRPGRLKRLGETSEEYAQPLRFHAPTGLSQARPDAARTCRGTGGGLDIGRSV